MLKPSRDEVPQVTSAQTGKSPYETMLQECLRGELRIVNAGLPQSQRPLSDLLAEEYPHVLCNDGSTLFFKKTELHYLASVLDTNEQRALLLPVLIEVGANQREAGVLALSGHGGRLEEKLISKVLNMPVACQGGRISIYKPQLALLRKRMRTTTAYVFSSRTID